MPSDFRWHFFLVSAGYLPDTVFSPVLQAVSKNAIAIIHATKVLKLFLRLFALLPMIHPPRIGLDSLILFFFILNESYQTGFSISPHDSIFNISKKKKRFLIFLSKSVF